MSTVEEFLKKDIALPSAPGIAVRIIDMVQGEDFSFNRLGALIQSDPALTARILRLVNSGYYGLSHPIASIDVAIGLLGANAVKNIALSFTIVDAFRTQSTDRFDFERFWRRAVVAAVAADLISDAVRFKGEEVFITSLLQDIGIAAMFTCCRHDYDRVLEARATSGRTTTEIEKEIYGFDHQEAGSDLLRLWRLPESVYLPIRFHHDVQQAPADVRVICDILRVADRISAGYHGSNQMESIREAHQLLSSRFKLSEAENIRLVDAVADQSTLILAQFDIAGDQMKRFSTVLQEANAELSRLNLSYEMLLMEYKLAKEKAERLTLELRAANEKLGNLASHDGLTGIFNRNYLQEAIVTEITRSNRQNAPFVLIMLDIDNFKKVNDSFGHQCGDIVLQAVSRQIAQMTRKTDTLGRYGGEEFMIILSDISLSTGLARAESFRCAIEQMVITAGDVQVRTTVSLGVATYNPATPVGKDELIRAADQALYMSKQAGRNRVSGQDL